MSKAEKLQKEAKAYLLEVLKDGDTLFTVLRHVSQSGMMRHIDVYVIRDNRPVYLSGWIANLCGYSRSKDSAIKVSGCGMDMDFEVVYSTSASLFGYDNRGAYALKQEWL